MPVFRYALLAVLAVLLAGTAAAQPRSAAAITGSVLDAETETPIPSASVAVWRVTAEDTTLATGAITDAEGAFRVEGVRPGRYRVDVSFIGYRTERREDVAVGSGVTDLGTIALDPDIAQLEGVEVAARREQVQVQIDRTVYSTADDPASAGGSATNVLEGIPSVDVDVDGNVSLRGSGNVAILINGRPAPVGAEFIAAYLQSLPAGTIDRVEVIPNPSARFEPEGMGGILNIILKENVDRGAGGSVSAGADTQGGYNASGTLTYGRGPWNLGATYGFRQSERGGGGSSFSITRPEGVPGTILDQVEDEESSGTSHNVNLSADYAFSRSTSLSASGQLGVRSEREIEVNDFLERLDLGEDPVLAYERFVEEEGERWNADARLGFRHAFGPQDGAAHALSAEARYNVSGNTDDELFTQTGDRPELQRSTTGRDRNEASLALDYVRPLGDFRVELGYKGDLESYVSDLFAETQIAAGVFEPDTLLNNAFDFDQQIHAVYGQLARAWGPLGVQLGLRAETARTTFTLENTATAYDNDYASLFPSAFLSYELGDDNVFKASYSRRINRPRTWSLNPFPSLDDPRFPRVGNPALRPEYISSFELGYVRYTPWGSLTVTPYYRSTTDAIRRLETFCGDEVSDIIRALCENEDVVSVRTVQNLATDESYGVEIINSFEGRGALAGLRGYVSLEGFRSVSDDAGGDLQNDAFGWGGRVNASYDFGARTALDGLTLQANLRYRAPMDTEQGRRGAFTFLNLALRQQLLGDRASLTLNFRDPFGLAGFDFVLDQPRLYQESERRWGAQQVGLTFTYNFGQQQRQRPGRDRGDREGMEEMEPEGLE